MGSEQGAVCTLPRPERKKGRHADPVTLGFEGSLEGLAVCKEDAKLDADWTIDLRGVLGLARMLWNRSMVTGDLRGADLEMRRVFRTAEAILEEIESREKRLDSVVEPEQQKVVSALDHEIDDRAHFAALARKYDHA